MNSIQNTCYRDFMQSCQQFQQSQKSLTKNIRIIVYSFLSLNQSYLLVKQLNKSENQAIPYFQSYRTSKKEQLYINPDQFWCKGDFQFLKQCSKDYVILFRYFINQNQVNNLLDFLITIDNDQDPEVSIEIDQCFNVESRITINQNMSYRRIKFNCLTITKSEFTLSDSNIHKLLNLFPKICLKDSYIGHQLKYLVIDRSNNLQYLESPAYNSFQNLRELRMDYCIFIDSRMLASLLNLEVLKMNDTLLSQISVDVLKNEKNQGRLQVFEYLYTKDQIRQHKEFNLDYIHADIFKFNFSTQYFRNIQKVRLNIKSSLLQFQLNHLKFSEYRNTDIVIRIDDTLDLQQLLKKQFFRINCRSLTFQASSVIYYNEEYERKYQMFGNNLNLSLADKLNRYYEVQEIQVRMIQIQKESKEKFYLQFAKGSSNYPKIIKLQVKNQDLNSRNLQVNGQIQVK